MKAAKGEKVAMAAKVLMATKDGLDGAKAVKVVKAVKESKIAMAAKVAMAAKDGLGGVKAAKAVKAANTAKIAMAVMAAMVAKVANRPLFLTRIVSLLSHESFSAPLRCSAKYYRCFCKLPSSVGLRYFHCFCCFCCFYGGL